MGRRQHESLETDALLARKDEQISSLDTRLHQIITHLSLVRARLLSTLDQVDVLQQEHTAALATAAREQQRLEVKLRAAEEMARAGEADRMDMRDAVAMLVKKVEATPDFRNWPRSQIQLSSLSEPSRHSPTHQPALTYSSPVSPSKSYRRKYNLSSSNDSEARRTISSAEQLAHASTLISHFREERDTALLRAEQSETRALVLEARLARRDADLESCKCATAVTTGTRPSDAGQSQSYVRSAQGRSPSGRTVDPFWSSLRRKPRNKAELDPLAVDTDVGMDEILDVSLDRNRELEREVQALSRQLDRVRVAQGSGSFRGTNTDSRHASTYKERLAYEQQATDASHVQVYVDRASPRVFTPPPRHHSLQYHHQQSPSPLPHRQDDGDASLLSSLSFSPSSTATSGGTGEATPRQYEYEYHDPHNQPPYEQADDPGGFSDSENAYEDVFQDMAEDESVTQAQAVDLDNGKPIHHLHHDLNDVHSDDLHDYDINSIKSIPVPIPSLHALHSQIVLLGEKIDAFAAERRRTAGEASTGLKAKRDGARPVQMEAEVGMADVYNDEDERRARSVITASEGEDWGGDDLMANRIRDEREDDGERGGGGGGENSRTVSLYVQAEGGARSMHRGADTNSTTQHNCTEDGESGNDADARYTRTLLPPPRLSPLPLPMPLSLPTPLPQTQASLTPPKIAPGKPGYTYDHPHETCEATLLAARTREMRLVERVRVLEGALAVVEAQVRRRGEMDAVAEQAASAQDETEADWVDVAVQTLFVLPQTSLTTLPPVGDLLGLDVSDLPVAAEGPRVGLERERENVRATDADDGEMPMELATPLWSVGALPIVPNADLDARTEGDSDNSAGGYGCEGSGSLQGPASDDHGGVASDGEQTSACDGEVPVSLDDVTNSSEAREISPQVNSNQPLEREDAELSMDPPLPAVIPALSPSAIHASPPLPSRSTRHPASPSAQSSTPSPPSSTGTSPTLAVGLLPPLPPHAHLSLPASLLYHSHHGSSLSSPLLPLPNPHAHSGLRRAHTDSDIGAGSHSQHAESAHRFVMYRATSSFVAELRQAETRFAETEVRHEAQSTLEVTGDLAASSMNNADAGMTAEKEWPDSNEDLPPLETLY